MAVSIGRRSSAVAVALASVLVSLALGMNASARGPEVDLAAMKSATVVDTCKSYDCGLYSIPSYDETYITIHFGSFYEKTGAYQVSSWYGSAPGSIATFGTHILWKCTYALY